MLQAETMRVPIKRQYLGEGDNAIYKTLDLMKDISLESMKNPNIRYFVASMLSRNPVNKLEELNSIFNFIKRRTRFLRDPINYELLQTPDFVIMLINSGEMPTLDCDDMAMLAATMLGVVGYDTAFKAVSTNHDNEFNHVYCLVKLSNLSGGWMGFDPSNPIASIGTEPPIITRAYIKEVWDD